MGLPVVHISIRYILAHCSGLPMSISLQATWERGRNVSCCRPLTASYWFGLAGMNTFMSVVKSSGFLFSVGLHSRSFMQKSLALLEMYGWSSDRSLCASIGDEDCWYICLRHVSLDGVCTSSPSGPRSLLPGKKPSHTNHASLREISWRKMWTLH